MLCPTCTRPFGRQIDAHHDHLSLVAIEALRNAGYKHLGHRYDRLQRSERFQALLRFSGTVRVCTRCNTLENAWKKRSNKRGFLPREFSLTPDEIALVREIGASKNSDARVRAALWSIWRAQRRKHKRRMRKVKRATAFLAC